MAESAPSAEQLLEALLAELSATDAVAQVTTQLFGWWPTAVIFFMTLIALSLVNRFYLARVEAQKSAKLSRQLMKVGVVIAALIAVILTLPASDSTRQELLSVFGLVLTAVITLSSTTLVANAIAGLMLRGVKSFAPGDFIRIDDQFGRITELGFFHTEIQTEDRDLTTLPNQYLISTPYTVVHSTGTIVSAMVSLGYDIERHRIENALLDGAVQAGLTDSFVQVTELGDYAVSYRISGFLSEVKQLLTARSVLRKKVLDSLHSQKIEIVSPSFMNQRQFDDRSRFIPATPTPSDHEEGQTLPESMIFDKADIAEAVVQLAAEKKQLSEQLDSLRSSSDSELAATTSFQIQYLKSRLRAIKELLHQHKGDHD